MSAGGSVPVSPNHLILQAIPPECVRSIEPSLWAISVGAFETQSQIPFAMLQHLRAIS